MTKQTFDGSMFTAQQFAAIQGLAGRYAVVQSFEIDEAAILVRQHTSRFDGAVGAENSKQVGGSCMGWDRPDP